MGKIWMPGGGGSTDLDVITAGAGDLLAGKVIVDKDGNPLIGTMPNHGAVSQALNCGGSYTIPAGCHNGSGKVTANSLASQTSATATAADILEGKTAYVNGNKLTGSMATLAGGTYTAGSSTQTISCSGKKMTSNIVINPASSITNLTAANIKKGVTIGGVTGTWEGYVASATDLYYKGVNALQFDAHTLNGPTLAFESDKIISPTPKMALYSKKSFNFTGYKQLIIEGSEFAVSDGTGKHHKFTICKSVSNSEMFAYANTYEASATETKIIFNFNHGVTYPIALYLAGGNSNTKLIVTRIRVA